MSSGLADAINTSVIDTERMTVSGDVACAGCGYNLRTLSVSSVCPECGHPVTDSLRDDLRFADARWLRRLRLATTLMLLATVGMVCSFCLIAIQAVFGVWPEWLFYYGVLATVVCWCGGVVLGTSREPGAESRAVRGVLRWTARVCALLAVGLRAFVLVLWYSDLPFRLRDWLGYPLYRSLFILPFLAPMTVCWYFRPIDTRGRRGWLRRLNTALVLLLGLGLLSMVCLAFLEPLVRDYDISTELVLGGLFLLYLLCFVMGVVSFVGHRRMFTRALAGRER